MASARASSGCADSRLSITLFSAKAKPPRRANASGSRPAWPAAAPPSWDSTSAAPASAIATRTTALAVSFSLRITRASSSDHSGIR